MAFYFREDRPMKAKLDLEGGLPVVSLWRGVLLLVLAFALTAPLSGQELRKWTDSTGSFSIEAKFVSLVDGKVSLQTADGELIEVPLDRLSAADKTHATSEAAKAASNPFKRKAANPFTSVPRSTGAATTPGIGSPPPVSGSPREFRADAGSARMVAMAGEGEWKIEPDSGPKFSGQLRPIPLPPKTEFFEKPVGLCVSGNGRYAVVGYFFQAPGQRSGGRARLALSDLQEGKGLGSGVVPDANFVPIALHDSGTKVLMRSDEFGFGNHDQLEMWALTKTGIERQTKWTPYDAAERGNRDVQWAAYLGEDRLATSNDQGQLIVWDANTGKGIYQLHIKGTPALSPGGKYLAFLTDSQVGILDAAAGNVLAMQTSPMRGGRLAFTPSGTRLVGATSGNLYTWDVATGELQRETQIEGAGFHGFLICPSEEHAIGDHYRLYDLVNQLALWEYRGIGQMAATGGVCWMSVVGGANQPAALVPARLPHKAIDQKLAETLADPNFFIFKPGATVKLDLSKLPDEAGRKEAQDGLTKKLAEQNIKVNSSAAVTLVAEMKKGDRKTLRFRMHGFGGFKTEEHKITQYTTTLSIVYQDKSLWRTSGTNLPFFFVQLEEDETLKQFMKKRDKPDYEWFGRITLPKMLTSQASQSTLGVSNVTVSGI